MLRGGRLRRGGGGREFRLLRHGTQHQKNDHQPQRKGGDDRGGIAHGADLSMETGISKRNGRLSTAKEGCVAAAQAFDFAPHPSEPAVKSHELFSTVDPAVVTEILDWFRANDRNVYKTAVSTLAGSRKLRPVFIQQKSLADQYAWIHKTLQIRACDEIGEQILQAYLMAGQQSMLGMFCDGMGIPHDGKTREKRIYKKLEREREREQGRRGKWWRERWGGDWRRGGMKCFIRTCD